MPISIDHTSVLLSFRHKQCACAGGKELGRSLSQLNAAAMPYVPAGVSGYESQEQAPQQSPITTIATKVGYTVLPTF